MGKAGEQGRINVREMDIEAEIARADKDDVVDKRPPVRKTARKVSSCALIWAVDPLSVW